MKPFFANSTHPRFPGMKPVVPSGFPFYVVEFPRIGEKLMEKYANVW